MTFKDMQDGELRWWKAFLKQPDATTRLLALYGYRYLPHFFREFDKLGAVIDFGSGPVSAAFIGQGLKSLACVDPLLESYHEAGLVWQAHRIVVYDDPPQKPGDVGYDAFDTALVLNTLDHTPEPYPVLQAAAKAARRVLVWVHIDHEPDKLHRTVTEMEVRRWIQAAGLRITRGGTHQDYGPRAFWAVAR